jgi:RNA polymerase primary sigma factor
MITNFGKKRDDYNDNDFFVKTLAEDSLSLYYKEIEGYKPLSKEEEKELFINLSNAKDELEIKAIKSKIIKHNLLFVVSVARAYSKKIVNSNFGVEELICEGNIGLTEAIETFKIDKDIKFISYAIWHIRKRIFLFLNENLHVHNITQNVRNKINIINELKLKMEKECGYELDYEYVINNSDIVRNNSKRSILMAIKTTSTSKIPITEVNDYLLQEDCFEAQYENDESDEMLKKSVNSLHPINKVLLCEFYGLYGYKQKKISKMSQEYQMPTHKIRKIIESSVKQLKENNDLVEFFTP